MEKNILGIMLMIKNKATGCSFGQMARVMKDSGLMGSSMGKESLQFRMARKKSPSGKMERL
jgi:hypothetical protein